MRILLFAQCPFIYISFLRKHCLFPGRCCLWLKDSFSFIEHRSRGATQIPVCLLLTHFQPIWFPFFQSRVFNRKYTAPPKAEHQKICKATESTSKTWNSLRELCRPCRIFLSSTEENKLHVKVDTSILKPIMF